MLESSVIGSQIVAVIVKTPQRAAVDLCDEHGFSYETKAFQRASARLMTDDTLLVKIRYSRDGDKEFELIGESSSVMCGILAPKPPFPEPRPIGVICNELQLRCREAGLSMLCVVGDDLWAMRFGEFDPLDIEQMCAFTGLEPGRWADKIEAAKAAKKRHEEAVEAGLVRGGEVPNDCHGEGAQ
jgi:hypothetical protein